MDPKLINPRAKRLVKTFKDAMIRMRDEDGLTIEDLDKTASVLMRVQQATGVPLSLAAMHVLRISVRLSRKARASTGLTRPSDGGPSTDLHCR
ncbi:hypothetical protein [Arthrobacter bambusae]|uniref:hypothetical protein n=1 Tax=Arthrobacter bambusae TaxID=1338426 RepID=UPI002788B962|nr:hypothetical protein [Arthrobacter bambusae]MDQ0029048.1 hypothetical protein [Arthrobacter bambusae]MDQ0098550.1 hypothetical protein [Arthrobacter bambusae]